LGIIGRMKYTIEMASDSMIYTPSFMMIGLGILGNNKVIVRFEVFTAVTMKNRFLRNVGSYKSHTA
jgi:hypothetical protein